ncbi:retrovirus-related Pol polyprotein from transposon 17.6 [Nephila pilipes]|uniref:Retrovirus-related Pol polyprotein from transposon 17.6 n=1 Tax=Nephila pilipes TaxID=299642 RepID=A0A8X6TRF4_NEPPI|nr:retrovirus-related Pol polyprotein from transposon 17.6 [Nephila pilipes]
MNEILGELKFCFVYLDDILIFSKSEAEHKTHVRAVFQKFQHYGLTINTSKCVFGVSEISFLGHLVTQQGTKPLPDRVEPTLNYPKPKTIKELQRFFGILNFFHRFLPNLAQHQIALSEFLKGTGKNDKRVIEWTTNLYLQKINCRCNAFGISKLGCRVDTARRCIRLCDRRSIVLNNR